MMRGLHTHQCVRFGTDEVTTQLNNLMRDLGHLLATVESLETVQEHWESRAPSPAKHTFSCPLQTVPPAFQSAYLESKQTLRHMPNLLYEVSLVHAESLFEIYISGLILQLFRKTPRMMLASQQQNRQPDTASKKLDFHQLLTASEQGIATTELMAEHSVRQLMFNSTDKILNAMRASFGFSSLTTQNDNSVILFSLIRNCIVHNGSIVNDDLEQASQSFYRRGKRIIVDKTVVTRAIAVYSHFAQAIDDVAVNSHGDF